jgi:hypothetical protein
LFETVWQTLFETLWQSLFETLWHSLLETLWHSLLETLWQILFETFWQTLFESVANLFETVWQTSLESVAKLGGNLCSNLCSIIFVSRFAEYFNVQPPAPPRATFSNNLKFGKIKKYLQFFFCSFRRRRRRTTSRRPSPWPSGSPKRTRDGATSCERNILFFDF